MDIQSYICEKRVDGTLASLLKSLDVEDVRAVEQLLHAVSPSANTLRSILQLAG